MGVPGVLHHSGKVSDRWLWVVPDPVDFQPKVYTSNLVLSYNLKVVIPMVAVYMSHTYLEFAGRSVVPSHTQLDHLYLTSVPDIMCMMLHSRLSHFYRARLKNLEWPGDKATSNSGSALSPLKLVISPPILKLCTIIFRILVEMIQPVKQKILRIKMTLMLKWLKTLRENWKMLMMSHSRAKV